MRKSELMSYLNKDGSKTAGYILAHALYQSGRGRRPSESYKGCANPDLAFDLALSEVNSRHRMPYTYTWCPGDSVEDVVGGMSALAKFCQIPIICRSDFGFRFVVFPEVPVWELIQAVHDARAYVSEWVGASIDQIESRIATEANRVQRAADMLMVKLPAMDFTDLFEVMGWVGKMSQYVTTNHSFIFRMEQIQVIFAQHGYVTHQEKVEAETSDPSPVDEARVIIERFLQNPSVPVWDDTVLWFRRNLAMSRHFKSRSAATVQ